MDEQDLMPFFMEIHSDNPREGPGSRASTTRAFQLLTELPSRPRILDVGCGPGMQTLDLARLTGGDITAVDNHPPYLEALRTHIDAQGLEARVRPVNGDMTALDFEPEHFDLIWSEGAIYIMGFEQGLRQWRRLLKPSGYLAVTELSWLIDNPPDAVRSFWAEGYPAMQTIDANLAIIEASGYQLINHFTLPSSDWWADYYNPIADKLPAFREKYHANTAAQKVAEMELAEMRLFREYETTYGYVFYTMQRVD
jgi:SAM-dependent methyltransferase